MEKHEVNLHVTVTVEAETEEEAEEKAWEMVANGEIDLLRDGYAFVD